MSLYLARMKSGETQSFGHLTYFGKQTISFFSLELPDKGNQPNISRIPNGTYNWKKWYSPTYKMEVIRLEGVPGRTNILIHPANYVSQLRGCIAIGLTAADINGDGFIDVTSSRAAVKKLVAALPETGQIHIT